VARRRHDEGAAVRAPPRPAARFRPIRGRKDHGRAGPARRRGIRPSPAFVRRIHRAAQGGRESGGLRRRGQEAIGNARSRAALGAARPGQDDLAHVIAHEMGTVARVTSGPALERKGDLAGILTSLGRGDVLFIDEIHRLQPIIEESLYPAMEDFRIEIVTGMGAGASAITVPIERFTLVGATTRTGQLTSPLLSRFGIVERLDFYAPASWPPSSGVRPSCSTSPAATTAPRSLAGGRAARPASPTACCAGCTISRWCAATARSRASPPTMRSSAWAWTRAGWTMATAIPARHHRALRRRPGWHRIAGRGPGRGSRHAGIRARALPYPGGFLSRAPRAADKPRRTPSSTCNSPAEPEHTNDPTHSSSGGLLSSASSLARTTEVST
jgi:hypothetical protein